MASWREEYMQALDIRDQREKAKYARISDDFIDAYTQLLEKATALEAEKAATLEAQPATTTPPSKHPKNPSPSPLSASSTETQLRSELAEALRANGTLTSRLKAAETELAYLRIQTKSDTKKLEDLTQERGVLKRKVKDRDEELHGKKAFVQETQDEMISLNLQLNMVEERNRKLKSENEELIERWMARKTREVEEMNKHWTE